MAKILLVEDDRAILKDTREWLEREHHTVEACERGFDALERMKFFEFDLIILDWNLPELTGIELLRQFRDNGGTTAVLMLTGKDGVQDIEAGLITGADDYLTKPFHLKELSARVTALVRRHGKVYQQVLKVRNIELNTGAHRVTKGGQEIKLQPKEFAVLEFLMRNPQDTFSVEALLTRIWPSDSDASPDTVRVCVTRLRNKIDTEGTPSIIRTVHRIGYQIEP